MAGYVISHVPYPKPGHMTPRDIGVITDTIIHHSAGSLTQTPLQIDAEHRARGMAMIGYNYVITPNGDIFFGRPNNVVPAAAFGRNTQSTNICVVGNFQSDDPGYSGPPTDHQMQSLQNLVLNLHHQYPHIVRTIGHRDVATQFYPATPGDYATACPGDKLYEQLGTLRSFISKKLASL